MSKGSNKPSVATSPEAPVAAAPETSVAASPETIVEPSAAPTTDTTVTAAPPETPAPPEASAKVTVKAVAAPYFQNPFTHEDIGVEPVAVTNDSWLQAQVAAQKIALV